MPSSPATLAVDLGGTRMRVAVVGRDGHLRDRREAPTPREAAHPDALVALMKEVLEGQRPEVLEGQRPEVLEGQEDGRVTAAVVGVPGPVDYREGKLAWAPHLPGSWVEDLTEARLSAALGLPVALANDADLAAVGEATTGAGRSFTDVVYITISTGIGAGVMLGDRLVHGRRSMVEIGHTVIDRAAYQRGEPATFEELASGTALHRLAAEAGLAGGGPEVGRLAQEGDVGATRVWDALTWAVGIGVSNLVELFSPDVIVVGGGVGLAGDVLLGPLRRFLGEHRPPGYRVAPEVVQAGLGDEAGLVGAAHWATAFVPEAAGRRPRPTERMVERAWGGPGSSARRGPRSRRRP